MPTECLEKRRALPAVYMDAEGRLTFYNEAAVASPARRDEVLRFLEALLADGTPLPPAVPNGDGTASGRPIRGMEAVAERPTTRPFITIRRRCSIRPGN